MIAYAQLHLSTGIAAGEPAFRMSLLVGAGHILISEGIGPSRTKGRLADMLLRGGTESLGGFSCECIHHRDILHQILRQAMPLLQIG